MAIAEMLGMTAFDYDADGMGGAAVHSDAGSSRGRARGAG